MFLLLALSAILVMSLVTFRTTVKAPGTLEPFPISVVRASTSGTVLETLVASGDTVGAGAILFRLDPREPRQQFDELVSRRDQLRLELEKLTRAAPFLDQQQRSRVVSAEAALTEARAMLRGALVDAGAHTGVDIDSVVRVHTPGLSVRLDGAVSRIRAATADLEGARAALGIVEAGSYDYAKTASQIAALTQLINGQRERLDQLIITSSVSGVVLTEDVHRLEGSRVAEGDGLVEIGNVNHWRAKLLLPESDASRISLGDSVRVRIRPLRRDSEQVVDGLVTSIGSQPVAADRPERQMAPNTYSVQVVLDSVDLAAIGLGRLRRGFTIQGDIVGRSGNALQLIWARIRETLDR